MTDVNRLPKGTPAGGQFAPSQNTESTVVISGTRSYEPLPNVGTIYQPSGPEVVDWVNGDFDGDVVMQVWDESDCVDPRTDWEGWEPKAIAQLLSERSPGKTEFDVGDIEEIFIAPDSDVGMIAFRPGMDSIDLLNAIEKELAQ